MTRLTFGIYRKGVREPGFTLSSTVGSLSFPTPITMAAAAVTRYHREGQTEAMGRLRRSFSDSSYWGSSGSPQARGWASAIVTSFERYVHLAESDGRDAFAVALKRDVAIGAHVVGVHVDAVLLDDDGYAGRITLWDRAAITSELAVQYAVPAFLALEEELGEGRVVGIQVWHLRTGERHFASSDACNAAVDRVTRLVSQIAR